MKKPTKAMLVTTEGDCRMVRLERTMQINEYIGCEFFDVIRLGDGADMFIDDTGLLTDAAANMVASAIAVSVTGKPYELRGDVLILGGNDQTGETEDCPDWVVSMVNASDVAARQFVATIINDVTGFRNKHEEGGQGAN